MKTYTIHTENSKWQQVAGDRFEEEALTGCYVWVSDGVYGYARKLAAGETVEQAVADFESAGEPAGEFRVYRDGKWVE